MKIDKLEAKSDRLQMTSDRLEGEHAEDTNVIRDLQEQFLPLYKFNLLEDHVEKIFKLNKSNQSPSKSKQARTPKSQQESPAKSPSSSAKPSDASTIR